MEHSQGRMTLDVMVFSTSDPIKWLDIWTVQEDSALRWDAFRRAMFVLVHKEVSTSSSYIHPPDG